MNIKLSTGIYLLLLLLSGKFIALVKDIALSSFYGVSWQADAFFIANGLSLLIFSAFYSTIPLVFLPAYNKLREGFGASLAYRFANKFINVYLLVALFLCCFSIYFAPEIIALLAPDIPSATYNLSVDLGRIFSLSFVFTVIIGVFVSMQQVNKFFIGSQLIPLINNSFIILAIVFLSEYFGLKVVAFFAVLAWLVQIPLQKYFIDSEYKYEFIIDLKDKNIRALAVLFYPAFAGTLIAQLNTLVDIYLASGLDQGTVSAMNYASRLMMLVSLLFPMVITTIMFPYFSDFFIKNRFQRLKVSIEKSIKITLILTAPLLVFFVIFNVEIIRIIFERGEFNESATLLTGNIFLYYSLAIIFIALRELFNKVFYAMEEPRVIMYISGFSVSLNVVLSFILVGEYQAVGLAMATSISVLIHVVAQFVFLKNRLGSRFFRKLHLFFIKVLLSSMIMIIGLLLFKNTQDTGNVYLDIFLALTVSVFLYGASLYFMRQKETRFFIASLIEAAKSGFVWKKIE